MSPHDFRQVDVFGSSTGDGNPLAVVLGADDLDGSAMQRFARWTNLSETTFLLRPTRSDADYRVRIFTPGRELPFAGHPTLGSAAAWLEAGGRGQQDVLVQECGAGLVPVRHEADGLAFAAPPLTRSGPADADLRARLATGLGMAPEQLLEVCWIVNGPEWVGVRLASAEQVLALRPDPSALAGLDVGVIGPHPSGSPADVEVRAFVGESTGVVEDPVTGSLNAGLAQWLTATGQLPPRYVAAQGTRLGRAGRVRLRHEGGTVWVGGAVRTLIRGTVDL